MSRSIHKYRIFCNTESVYTFTWNDSLPSTCPNNSQHSIDTGTITIVETIQSNDVNIIQEKTPTGGNYRTESRKITAQSGVNDIDLSFPYGVSVMTISMYPTSENTNDIVNVYVSPNTNIGTLLEDVSANENTLKVSSQVFDVLNIGYRVYIDSVVLGECISMDRSTNTIVLDSVIPQSFTTGDNVQMSINNIKNFILLGDVQYDLSRKSITSSYIPANTIIRISYNNLSNNTKYFYYTFEYLY